MIYTFGHSTHSIEKFVGILQSFSIKQVLDVRTIPRSRRNPQYNQDSLNESLRAADIGYAHMKGLGGWRKPAKDSINLGWENASFRGYADYMMAETFEKNLVQLIAYGQEKLSLILCAETLPWKCHRLLIADALIVRGIHVEHILGVGKVIQHELTRGIVVDGTKIAYP